MAVHRNNPPGKHTSHNSRPAHYPRTWNYSFRKFQVHQRAQGSRSGAAGTSASMNSFDFSLVEEQDPSVGSSPSTLRRIPSRFSSPRLTLPVGPARRARSCRTQGKLVCPAGPWLDARNSVTGATLRLVFGRGLGPLRRLLRCLYLSVWTVALISLICIHGCVPSWQRKGIVCSMIVRFRLKSATRPIPTTLRRR